MVKLDIYAKLLKNISLHYNFSIKFIKTHSTWLNEFLSVSYDFLPSVIRKPPKHNYIAFINLTNA